MPPTSSLLLLVRRSHAWVGVTGAVFGLLFGITGILQNHRAVMKIGLGRVEERKVRVELDTPAASPEALLQDLRSRLGWDPARSAVQIQAPRNAQFQGAEIRNPPLWILTYRGHRHFAKASYSPGNRSVDLEQKDADLVETLSRLHKADAGQVGWILLADAAGMGFIFTSLSGLLLWTRLRGPRILAVGLVSAATLSTVLVVSRFW